MLPLVGSLLLGLISFPLDALIAGSLYCFVVHSYTRYSCVLRPGSVSCLHFSSPACACSSQQGLAAGTRPTTSVRDFSVRKQAVRFFLLDLLIPRFNRCSLKNFLHRVSVLIKCTILSLAPSSSCRCRLCFVVCIPCLILLKVLSRVKPVLLLSYRIKNLDVF
jgi:hypothetical protein